MPVQPSPAVLAAIQRAAAATGVPLVLAEAVAFTESGFNPNAIGDSGHSVGLYQLNDQGEGAGLTVVQREDPYQNAFIALSRLGSLYKANPNQDPGVLAAQAQRPANQPAYAQLVDYAIASDSSSTVNGVPNTGPNSTPGGVGQNPLVGAGHGIADWIVGVGKSAGGLVSSNLVGFAVAGIMLYIVFAPDVAGTSRV